MLCDQSELLCYLGFYLANQGTMSVSITKKVRSVPNSLFRIVQDRGVKVIAVQADVSGTFIDLGGGK